MTVYTASGCPEYLCGGASTETGGTAFRDILTEVGDHATLCAMDGGVATAAAVHRRIDAEGLIGPVEEPLFRKPEQAELERQKALIMVAAKALTSTLAGTKSDRQRLATASAAFLALARCTDEHGSLLSVKPPRY